MGRWLEHLLVGAASARWLPLWSGLQVAAAIASLGWFVLRTPGTLARLRVCLALAFLGAAGGAVGLGILTRIPAWVRSGYAWSALVHGGIMAYGALLGVTGTYAALARLRGYGVGPALDRLSPCLGVMVLVARTGCFFGGCDFGSITRVPWAVRFPPGSAAFEQHIAMGLILRGDRASLAVHPAQLYEAAVGLAMCAVALRVERRGSGDPAYPAGAAFAATSATYAAGRFIVEFFRGDAGRGGLGPMSTPQWISAAVLAAAALWATVWRACTRAS